MKHFLIIWALASLGWSIWMAIQKTRAIRRIALGRLSLEDVKNACPNDYEMAKHPAFIDGFEYVIMTGKALNPYVQWGQRWFVIMPFGIVVNIINPLTWGLSLIGAIVIWGLSRVT
jgi:hypothetical protein